MIKSKHGMNLALNSGLRHKYNTKIIKNEQGITNGIVVLVVVNETESAIPLH